MTNQVEHSQFIRQCLSLGLVNPHQRGRKDKLPSMARLSVTLNGFDKCVPAIGIPKLRLHFATCHDVIDALFAGIDGGNAKKQVAPRHKSVRKLVCRFRPSTYIPGSGQRIMPQLADKGNPSITSRFTRYLPRQSTSLLGASAHRKLNDILS